MPLSRTPLVLIASIAITAGLCGPTAEAKSLRECGRAVRVGSKLVMIGDSSQRADALFASHSQWAKKRSTKSQAVWVSRGSNKRTVQLKFQNGKIADICQRS